MHVSSVLAHAGHPGSETHGLLTHLALGLMIALPLVFGALTAMKRRKQATISIKTPR